MTPEKLTGVIPVSLGGTGVTSIQSLKTLVGGATLGSVAVKSLSYNSPGRSSLSGAYFIYDAEPDNFGYSVRIEIESSGGKKEASAAEYSSYGDIIGVYYNPKITTRISSGGSPAITVTFSYVKII